MESNDPPLTLRHRRTKIVATLGPACSDAPTIEALIEAGTNVFRLNMSHGTQAEHRERYRQIRAAAEKLKRPVAVLADLCGPKIRVGLFEGGGVDLIDNTNVTITMETVLGTSARFSSQYAALCADVEPGSRILLDDGNLELRVLFVAGTEVHCVVVHGGRLKDKKGMNLPNVKVSAPALTDKDRGDAVFATQLGVDFIALSFVRSHTDLVGLRALLAEQGAHTLIVAKIEKPEALDDIDAILDQSDAIMVARGDLGVELDLARVPNIQEELVDRARAKHKPVIVATQMLESMITAARPTRAEVTDVANAVRSGADAVMLSAETAAGHQPVLAVRTMDLIVRHTEAYLFDHGAFGNFDAYTPTAEEANPKSCRDAEEAVANAAADMSRHLLTCGIVALGHSRKLLALLSSKRPSAVILAPANDLSCFAVGCLCWGVLPFAPPNSESGGADAIVRALESRVELEQSQGFWLLASSNEGKNATLSVVSR